jgi:Collagen triple helix repeat (20 copies)
MSSLKYAGMLVVCGLLAGTAAMAAPNSTSIYACVSNSTGAVRIVAASGDCLSGETQVAWAVVGPAGATGATGAMGSPGAPGAAGAQGPAGPAGATGPAGVAGPAGATGPAGVAGPAGATGPAGVAGPAGATGATGAAGVAGPAGATGPAGPAGSLGPQGNTGPAGPEGPTGPQGSVGPGFLTGHTVGIPGGTTEIFGTFSGIANASSSPTNVEVLSPDRTITATRVTFVPTGTVGSTGENIYLQVGSTLTGLACHLANSSGCTATGSVTISPNSVITFRVANCCDASPGDMLATLEFQ